MTVHSKTDYRDLTTGSIWKKLSVFALPLLLSFLVQQLYNTVDLIFAGNLIDANASAAIGMSGMLITCLVGFFGGLSVGAGAVIARAFGSEDYPRLRAAIHSTVALCAAGGLMLLSVGEGLTPVYLKLVRTPEALDGMASNTCASTLSPCPRSYSTTCARACCARWATAAARSSRRRSGDC